MSICINCFLLRCQKRIVVFLFAILVGIHFGHQVNAQVEQWNAILKSPGGDLRFGLELEKRSDGDSWRATLLNGQERIAVPKVVVSDDRSIQLAIDHYDSTVTFNRVERAGSKTELIGLWKKRRGPDRWVEMEFRASPARSKNVNAVDSHPKVFDGRWSVKFESSDEPAVGIFETDGSSGKLLGTFLTTTGDYRFLAGDADGGKLHLSCFDGAHAFLFSAKLQSDGSLKGDFWSSDTWHETWTAKRNKTAKLADSFEATKVAGESINELSFPNLEGDVTRLNDESFLAPVRIVHIFGSWCPNCHDAGKYLAELKKHYGNSISIVGIAFELTGDFERDAKQVRSYLRRHDLDHPVLIGGTSNKQLASEAIKIIDQVRSYPTTIFANAEGKIVAVHQGFSGPATGNAYTEQSARFRETIDNILTPIK